jgi:crossover junction endodeoxyribonuclease RuvC
VRVIGIDPGVTGALAVVIGSRSTGELRVESVHDLPIYTEKTSTGKTRKHVDPVGLRDLLKQIGPVDRVVCERLNAPPGIATTVAFSMGATLGTIISVLRLAKSPYKLVAPSVWKRALECPADKEASRLFAGKVFKDSKHWARKKDHNRSEASLIAAWSVLSG